jgi:hypothetical protein
MRRVSFLIMVSLFFSTLSLASESLSQQPAKSRRIYVDSDKVKITDKGLFLSIDNIAIPISGVFSDKKGLFIKEIQLKKSPECQSKGLHRCLCHNPDCPRENKIFIATEWRPYCSDRCEYEAIASGHEYKPHHKPHHHRHHHK